MTVPRAPVTILCENFSSWRMDFVGDTVRVWTTTPVVNGLRRELETSARWYSGATSVEFLELEHGS